MPRPAPLRARSLALARPAEDLASAPSPLRRPGRSLRTAPTGSPGERVPTRLGLTSTRMAACAPAVAGRERLLRSASPSSCARLLDRHRHPRPDRRASAGPAGGGDAPRLAVAGLENGGDATTRGSASTVRSILPGPPASTCRAMRTSAAGQPAGPYLADGTLLKPIAVDTSIADGADTLRSYKVRSGDTLTGIARHFGVSMMTLWWANHLKSKDDLKVGQKLVIPPVDGPVSRRQGRRDAAPRSPTQPTCPRPTSSRSTASPIRPSSSARP